MNQKHKKVLVVSLKILIAIALVGWVCSMADWHDYVVAKGTGKSYSVVEARPSGSSPQTLTVSRGLLWWRTVEEGRPASDFEPQGGVLIHPGFATSISSLDPAYLVGACAIYLVSLIVVGTRWWFLLRIQDIFITFWEAIRLTFLGLFFNTVVPGTVGGDLIKAYYVSKHTPKKAAVLVSVVVDRVLGLTELTLLATVMLTVVVASGMGTLENKYLRGAAIAIAVVVAIVIGALFFLFSTKFRRALHLEKIYQRLPLAHHFAAAGDAATLYRQRIGSLVKAVAMTFAAHLLWVTALVMVGKSLHVPVPLFSFYLYLPLIYIIGAVPVTPGGVGLIERLYLLFFAVDPSGLPVDPNRVLAFALLARLIPIFWGLPGILVAITGPRLPKAAAMEAELGLAEEEPAQP